MCCGICFDTIIDGISVYITLSCKHKFHYKCLEKWLYKNTCPNCRHIIILANADVVTNVSTDVVTDVVTNVSTYVVTDVVVDNSSNTLLDNFNIVTNYINETNKSYDDFINIIHLKFNISKTCVKIMDTEKYQTNNNIHLIQLRYIDSFYNMDNMYPYYDKNNIEINTYINNLYNHVICNNYNEDEFNEIVKFSMQISLLCAKVILQNLHYENNVLLLIYKMDTFNITELHSLYHYKININDFKKKYSFLI